MWFVWKTGSLGWCSGANESRDACPVTIVDLSGIRAYKDIVAFFYSGTGHFINGPPKPETCWGGRSYKLWEELILQWALWMTQKL